MDRIRRRDFLVGAGATAGTAIAAGSILNLFKGSTPARTFRPRARPPINPSECPVDTIVFMEMENHSFDNMLGRLPGARGLFPLMNNFDAEGNRVFVHRQQDFPCTFGDLNHSRNNTVEQWNNGRMDGFARNTGSQTMGYFNAEEAPWIYAAAQSFTAFDRWHCSILGPTWPNRSYPIAGTSGGRTNNGFSPGKIGLDEKTVFDQLSEANISWNYYFTDVPFAGLYLQTILKHLDRFHPISQFYDDAANGKLARVNWVDPGLLTGSDQHPPASIQPGDRLMADVAAALMHGPQWLKSAMFITYDEHGGFYDHMPPPQMPDDYPDLGAPIGIRVPGLVISPYAPAHQIGPQPMDHTSITKFIQWRFGLQPLSKRNAAATNPEYVFDWANPRQDVPQLPVPAVDDAMAFGCFLGHVFEPDGPYSLPGGEGPEQPGAWNAGSKPKVLAGPTVAPTPATPSATAPPAESPQPELEDAVGKVIPKELDLRPAFGKKIPTLFLDRATIAGRPARQR